MTGVALMALVSTIVGPGPAGAVPATRPVPTLTVTPARSAAGAEVEVTLAGFPPGIVTVELCGNAARRGSPDCAVADGRSVLATGRPVRTALRITVPPRPCPCVVRAVGIGGARAMLPIVVTGAATAPPDVTPPGRVEVVGARLTTAGRDWSVLAGPAHRTLRVRVANRGGRRSATTPVTVAVGRDIDAPLVTTGVTVPALAPGAERTLRIPIRVPPPAWGGYRVVVRVGPQRAVVRETFLAPWGVPALLGVAAACLAVTLARRRRTSMVPHDTRSSP